MIGGVAFFSAILLFSMTASSTFAHMRQLLTIGGKRYLLEVGSQVEPPYVGDKNGVQFFAYILNLHTRIQRPFLHVTSKNYLKNKTNIIIYHPCR